MAEDQKKGKARSFFDESGQLILPGQEDIVAVVFSEEERKGKYTAERLRTTRPKLYTFVAELLAEPGISYRAITKATGCHHNTLKAVEASDPKLIAAEKERVSAAYRQIRNLTADTIIEALTGDDAIKPTTTTDLQKLAIVGGIATEKAELLSGNPTQRVARPNEERLEDLEKHFKQLPLSDPIDAEYSFTSFDGETHEAKSDEPSDEVENA